MTPPPITARDGQYDYLPFHQSRASSPSINSFVPLPIPSVLPYIKICSMTLQSSQLSIHKHELPRNHVCNPLLQSLLQGLIASTNPLAMHAPPRNSAYLAPLVIAIADTMRPSSQETPCSAATMPTFSDVAQSARPAIWPPSFQPHNPPLSLNLSCDQPLVTLLYLCRESKLFMGNMLHCKMCWPILSSHSDTPIKLGSVHVKYTLGIFAVGPSGLLGSTTMGEAAPFEPFILVSLCNITTTSPIGTISRPDAIALDVDTKDKKLVLNIELS